MLKPRSTLRRSATEWASLVEACERSGLSRAAFAEREGIQPGTFSYWASRLAPKQGRKGKASDRAAASSFVPVRVRARDAVTVRGVAGSGRVGLSELAVGVVPTAAAGDGIEIALANGRRVRCTLSQVGDPRLAALLAVAEGGRGC